MCVGGGGGWCACPPDLPMKINGFLSHFVSTVPGEGGTRGDFLMSYDAIISQPIICNPMGVSLCVIVFSAFFGKLEGGP